MPKEILKAETVRLKILKDANLSKPIRPDEVAAAKTALIPGEVFKAFNELIAREWDGHRAVVMQNDAINDDYMGSGKRITNAIKKHGKSAFTKEILFVFDNEQDMLDKEQELVTPELLESDTTYNLKLGGVGGFDHINTDEKLHKTYARKGGLKASQRETNPFKNGEWQLQHNPIFKPGYKSVLPESANSLEALKKKKATWKLKRRNVGQKNPQFGTCWVFNEQESIRIPREDTQQYLTKGYNLGRKMSLEKNKAAV